MTWLRRAVKLWLPSLIPSKCVSPDWSLRQLSLSGFSPDLVIDVGAYVGDWSRMARRYFPNARFMLFEAQQMKKSKLEQAALEIGNAEVIVALLGAKEQEDVPFFNLETGSSVLEEKGNVSDNVSNLTMNRLDSYFDASRYANIFLKLDVQGYEIEVLKGATVFLDKVRFIQLELSTQEYNVGAPLSHDVMAYLADHRFFLFDILDLRRHNLEKTLVQFDAIFMRQLHHHG